ncbi:hypothetical protein KEM52_004801 [Ascosphaera acerosa]|nr:hypothetical protein KEM52_004801 [Ascosphaera acerosa]
MGWEEARLSSPTTPPHTPACTHRLIPSADIIDKDTKEVRSDDTIYTNMEDLADDLPDSAPRFVLLSHPLTLPSGRLAVPYVMLYWLPENCNPSQRMTYASAVELMRNTAEVGRVIEVADEEDIVGIAKTLLAAQ